MDMQSYVPIDVFCRQHGVALSFISSLQEYGLIEIIQVEEADCLSITQLGEAEKLLRLHGELDINLEGIDVITHLLHRVQAMQQEILVLKNRLRLYEDV